MKRLSALILLLVFTVQNLYATGVTAWFYLNRTEIAKTLCINKSRPEMKCHGACQLKKKLQEADDNRDGELPAALREWTSLSPCELPGSPFLQGIAPLPAIYNLQPLSCTESPYIKAPERPPLR